MERFGDLGGDGDLLVVSESDVACIIFEFLYDLWSLMVDTKNLKLVQFTTSKPVFGRPENRGKEKKMIKSCPHRQN